MSDDAAKWARSRSKLYRRLKEYVGDRDSLDTTETDTIVGALNEVRDILATRCTSAAGLTIGTTSKKEVRIANTTAYVIDGVFYSKSAAEVGFTATTHDITANASSVQEAVYTLSIQADGTVTITKGTTATGSGNASAPAGVSGEAVIGYVRIAVDAGSTDFDATSDDLDATHLTVSYTDAAFIV